MKLLLATLILFFTGLNYHSNAEDPDLKKIADKSCCEDIFLEKEKIFKIRNNLQTCMDKKCYNFMLPLYVKKKPPAKLVALRNLNILEDLLISHDKYKYDNLILTD